MTPDDILDPCQITRARIARTRSLVIAEGDAVPFTHTALVAASDPEGQHPHPGHHPSPLRRNPTAAAVAALVPWWSLLLSALALSLLGAVTAWLRLPPVVGAAAAVSMAACCLVLVVAELVHRATAQRPSR